MSTTENSAPAAEPAAPEATEAPVENVASDADLAVEQLRALVCGMVVGLLLSSVAFTLFIFKQTRTMKYQVLSRQAQIQQIRDYEKAALPAINELAKYSLNRPELMAIFSRYGMQIGQNVAPVGGGTAPRTPAPAPAGGSNVERPLVPTLPGSR